MCIDCNRGESNANTISCKVPSITDIEYKNLQETVWISSNCAEKVTTEDTQELKVCWRYVDDIVLTVKGNTLEYLEYATSLCECHTYIKKDVQKTLRFKVKDLI